MEWWFALMCAGFVFEFGGLGLAARGLFQTWKAHANGRPFFPTSVRRAATWVRARVFRRAPHQSFGHAVGTFSSTGSLTAHGYALTPFTDDMTLEQKIDTAQDNALRALEGASRAHAAVRSETRDRTKADSGLTAQIESVDGRLTDYARGLVVDGIPVAVTGLAFAALGLLLQGVAAVATFPEVFTSH